MKAAVALSAFALLCLGVHAQDPDWWKTMSMYQVYPRSFMDSDGDGIGDLKGITSKLQYLADSKVNAFWLSPIYPSPMIDFGYDISDFVGIDPVYGNMTDFEELVEVAHNLSLKVIMDFVPNHCSDKHEWFGKSIKKIEPYTDYFIWHEGKIVNGVRRPPNNWNSVFRGPAWTWVEERQAYYLHQFAKEQPDLNFRSAAVREEMKNILRFWMNKGVDGFRVDAMPFLYEAANLSDEPKTGWTNDPNDHIYLNHIYTFNVEETYGMATEWRAVVDEFDNRVMMIEAYGDMMDTIKYYRYGAHFPFNFGFVVYVDNTTSAHNFKVVTDDWMNNIPPNSTSNWVAGNHDRPRLATRFGVDLARAVTAIIQLLPGVAVTYYGDEIGMQNTWISWEETQDPQGCNAGKADYEEKTRDPCRTPFQWDNSTSAGFSSNPKTWLRVNEHYKECNLEAQKADNNSAYHSFLAVTSLREMPAVKHGNLTTKVLDEKVFAFSRELEGEKSVYLLANLAHVPASVSLDAFANVPEELLYYHSTIDPTIQPGTKVGMKQAQKIMPQSASIFIAA